MRQFCVLLLSMLVGAGPALAGSPSTDEVVETVLDRVLGPIEEAAASQGVDRIVLVDEPGAMQIHNLGEVLATRFRDAGWEVYLPEPGAEAPADALRLVYQVDEVGVEFPRRWRGFLGIRGQKTARSVRLGLTAELVDGRTGRWIWRGSPRAHAEDWVSAPESIDDDHAFYGQRAEAPEELPPTEAGRFEKGLVAGLLGGVLLLYFSGVS